MSIINYISSHLYLVVILAFIILLVIIILRTRKKPVKDIQRTKNYLNYGILNSYPDEPVQKEISKKTSKEFEEMDRWLLEEHKKDLERIRKATNISPLRKGVLDKEEILPGEEDTGRSLLTPLFAHQCASSSKNCKSKFNWYWILVILVIIVFVGVFWYGVKTEKFKSFSNLICGNVSIEPTNCILNCSPSFNQQCPDCNCNSTYNFTIINELNSS